MNLLELKSHFKYSTSQRSGIFLLLALIIVFQLVYFFVDLDPMETENNKEKQAWLSLQSEMDKATEEKQTTATPKIYPFNPNFITDFKGYKLGMSVQEIDRLIAYRKTNKYVNSAQEFQAVTKVSDSLLKVIAPYFKFPDWVNNKKEFKAYQNSEKKEKVVVLDINEATQEDLKKIYGIGDALSERIIKEKQKLGGFMSMEQMNDVWGLSPEVIAQLNKNFKIKTVPVVKKIDINNATIKELMQLPYFKYALAKSIVTFRSMNNGIKSKEDLQKIKDFPVEKANIIVLYLEF